MIQVLKWVILGASYSVIISHYNWLWGIWLPTASYLCLGHCWITRQGTGQWKGGEGKWRAKVIPGNQHGEKRCCEIVARGGTVMSNNSCSPRMDSWRQNKLFLLYSNLLCCLHSYNEHWGLHVLYFEDIFDKVIQCTKRTAYLSSTFFLRWVDTMVQDSLSLKLYLWCQSEQTLFTQGE